MTTQRTGIIDVGGGMRGIYAAGVFDRCIDDGVRIDVAIGISAGSANVSSFVSGQRGRNIAFYTEYTSHPEYMSPQNVLHKGEYLDTSYVYGTLSNEDGQDPFDYDAFMASPTEVYIEACNAVTGESVYFDKTSFERNSYQPLMASSAIPVVSRPCMIDGQPYYDGALGDTVPVEKAFELGCTKVVLVLTKPADVPRRPGKDIFLSRLVSRHYPKAAERLIGRADRYNYGVGLALALQQDGLVLVLAPDDTCGVDTLTKDPDDMMRLYRKGYADGEAVKPFLEGRPNS